MDEKTATLARGAGNTSRQHIYALRKLFELFTGRAPFQTVAADMRFVRVRHDSKNLPPSIVQELEQEGIRHEERIEDSADSVA